MSAGWGDEVIARRAARAVVLLGISIAFDLLVVVTSLVMRHAFVHAPNDSSLQPADDSDYFVAGFGYAISSVLRDLVIVAVVVLLWRWWLAARHSAEHRDRGRYWLCAVAAGVALEAVAIAVPWSEIYPSALFVVLKVTACAVNAVGSVLAIVAITAGMRLRRAPDEVRDFRVDPDAGRS